MWYWAELIRLTRALRHINAIRSNVLPRIEQIRRELETCGRFGESYELLNVRMYLDRLSKDTYTEVANQYHMIEQSYYGVRAPRTTPLVATSGDIHTS